MSIMTIITVTINANNFTIICSPCSVPYRGIRFLILKSIFFGTDDNKMFPSLTGVIRFLITADTEKKRRIKNNEVSVPYRGYSFFNSILTAALTTLMCYSFRPLQGLFVF